MADHHTAFVSCNRVSKRLESIFKAFTAEEDEDADADEQKCFETSSSSPPTLKEFYKVGDGVIGTIVAVQTGKADSKKRKRLELSLIPDQVNSDLMAEDLEIGTILPGEIKSIEDKGYVIDLGLQKETVGFMAYGAQDSEKLALGSVVHCRVLVKNRAVVTLEAAGDNPQTSAGLTNYNSFRPGTLVENVEIKAILDGIINVMINDTHSGQIDIFNLPVPSTLTAPKTQIAGITGNYFVGMKIPCARIVFADGHVGAEEKSLILSALPSVLSSDKVRRKVESISSETVTGLGTKYEDAHIVRVDPGLGVILALNSEAKEFAQVHISRLSDEKITKIIAPYRINSVHSCRIIDYDPFAAIAIASMAPSCLNQQFLSIENIPIGSVVRGEVSVITPGLGILVALSERIRALCPMIHLTETQSQDALKSYRLGQKFKFRVLSTDPSARRVMLTRKKGLLDSDLEPLCEYKDAIVGEFYDGYVASIRPFGCIVRFFGDVKAILPLSELTEETFVKDAKEVVFEGQVIRCRVIRLDREAKSMAVSLRKTDTPKTGAIKRKPVPVEGEEKDKEKVKKHKKSESEIETKAKAKTEKVLKVAKAEAVAEVTEEKVHLTPKSTSQSEASSCIKAVLPSLRQLEEEELAKEEMLMNSETVKPVQVNVSAEDLLSMKEMCDEFERRLLGSPNSSVLWIQYMSVLIKSMELEAARSLAQRALQTISIRSEGEKLNIWIALMNLEHSFGTPATLKAVFERACVYNDSKAVHLALAHIYEESARIEEAESIKTVENFYESVLMKKFRQSCKVWMNLAQFYFSVKKDAQMARKLLPKALEALPRRKHQKATLKFAQMEFRHGSLERGRTLFEGLIASSPGRLDVWSQFCDQEERHLPETTENVRHLYTRIIHLKLSSKKAKFFFKKFLEFEKQHGDQITIQNVKDLAQKYVETSMSKI